MSYGSSPIGSSGLGRAVRRLRIRDQINNEAIAAMTGAVEALALGDWNPANADPIIVIQTLTEALAARDMARTGEVTNILVDTAFAASRTGEFDPRTHKGLAFLEFVERAIEARLDAVESQLPKG